MSANLSNVPSGPADVDQGMLQSAWEWTKQVVTAPLRWSLAGRAALALFFFLVTLVVIVWIVLERDPNVVMWSSFATPTYIVTVILLVVATPIAAYYALRLWLEGEASRYPDIDFAWRTGLKALEDHGVDINATPIFLILGGGNEEEERALLQASGLRLRVEATPDGPAPLHWYANPEGVFLFCTETSWLSTLNSLRDRTPSTASTGSVSFQAAAIHTPAPQPAVQPAAPAPAVAAPTPPAEPAPPAPVPSAPAAPNPAPGHEGVHSGTIMLDQFVSEQSASTPMPAPAPAPVPAPTPTPTQLPAAEPAKQQGTMMLPAAGVTPEPQVAPAAAPSPAPTAAAQNQQSHAFTASTPNIAPVAARTGSPASLDQPSVVPARQSTEQLQRLQYVCRLLQKTREPFCAINGVLTLLPFESLQAPPSEAEELQRAVKSDLITIQRELQLRFPVCSLITGLENEQGFCELVRRVGRERSAAQRFGRKFDIRAVATPAELQALSIHLCGAFEDWVYTLYREPGVLAHPGNTHLYHLLCKVRCNLTGRLADVLSGGFGYDERTANGDDPISFSGCYFAATGVTPDRQAFVRGVIEKLVDEQEQIEWSPNALHDEKRFRSFAFWGVVACVALTIATVVMLTAISSS